METIIIECCEWRLYIIALFRPRCRDHIQWLAVVTLFRFEKLILMPVCTLLLLSLWTANLFYHRYCICLKKICNFWVNVWVMIVMHRYFTLHGKEFTLLLPPPFIGDCHSNSYTFYQLADQHLSRNSNSRFRIWSYHNIINWDCLLAFQRNDSNASYHASVSLHSSSNKYGKHCASLKNIASTLSLSASVFNCRLLPPMFVLNDVWPMLRRYFNGVTAALIHLLLSALDYRRKIKVKLMTRSSLSEIFARCCGYFRNFRRLDGLGALGLFRVTGRFSSLAL